MTSEWFSAPLAHPFEGDERFVGCAATVQDFWRFAMSDLRMNNVRGYLAEFLVAHAVDAVGQRIEWDAYDVLTPDGVKVEVKSSAYLQVWDQRAPSRIVFTGLRSRTVTAHAGQSVEPTYNADVYVFALQTATQHEDYDPLDVHQWRFFVLARQAVENHGHRSIGLATLEAIADGPTPYDELATAIAEASRARD